MTPAELRLLVADAAAAFGSTVVEKAYQAAVTVPTRDDPREYAREVAAAIARVLEGALEREREITLLLGLPITRWH